MHIWFDFLHSLTPGMQNWIKDISLMGFDARNIYLKAKTPFHILWFNEHIKPKFFEFLQTTKRKPLKIHFDTNQQKETQIVNFKEKIQQDNFLNPLFTRDNYYFSKRNPLLEFAIRSCPKLLYLYGEKGTGKTHLLHALAHLYHMQNAKIAVVATNKFIWHFTTAIRTRQMDIFRSFYRNVDALFLDDIEELDGKSATQEEFFHLFNEMHLMEKSMYFTAQKPPEKLKNLPSRIKSRFAMGLVVPIYPIDSQELNEFIRQKANKLHLLLEVGVIELFQNFSSTTKAIQAFETFIIRLHQTPTQTINKSFATQLLQDILEIPNKLDTKKILAAVAKSFNINTQDLLSSSKRYAKQRAIAMFFCRNKLHLSFIDIGKIFAKNHSTVIWAIKNIDHTQQQTIKNIEMSL